ncbi:MAG: TetR/AcrR family transcriptional regulator [Proteobacteria bacterium]|nr:TetR/AcrR family transcriptional regulator [Pseudomonadota bacterium]MBU1688390.1 TetR/AcrR family transcriptional regulator [Pseudomonadota bacterium]
MAGIRETKKLQTRQAIIDAAVKLFPRYGFELTSVDQLAREAGIGKGTIYGYFKTKDEIFFAFCEDEIDYVFKALAKSNNRQEPLLEQLHTLFMGQFRYVTRNREFGRILAREMLFPKEANKGKCRELEERYLAALGTILDRAVTRGELRADLEQYFTVGHFYALYLLILSSWYDGRLQSEEAIEEALRKLLEQAMGGLAPR